MVASSPSPPSTGGLPLLALTALVILSLLGVAQAADFSANNTVASGTGLVQARAGQGTGFRVYAFDVDGKSYTDPLNLVITFSLEGEAVPVTLTQGVSGGNYTFDYSTQLAGNYSVSIAVDNEQIQGSPFALVVLPRDPNPARSDASGTGSQPFVTVGVVNSFTIIFRDQFDNVVAHPPNIAFTATTVNSANQVYSAYRFVDGANVFEYSVNQTVTLDLVVLVNALPFWSREVQVLAGQVDLGNCDVDLPLVPSVGDDFAIEVLARDSYSNPVIPSLISSNPSQFSAEFVLLSPDGSLDPETPVLTVTSAFNKLTVAESTGYSLSANFNVSGLYQLTIRFGGSALGGFPQNIFIRSGEIYGFSSYLVGLPTEPVLVGDTVSFVIVTKDRFNNTRTWSQDKNFILVEAVSRTSLISPEAVDLNNGTYSISFVFDRSGTYVMNAYYLFEVISGSGTSLVAYTVTSAEDTVATGEGLSSCKIGNTCRFVVQARDRFGNNQTDSSDEVVITLNDKPLETEIEWVGEGMFAVSYTGRSGSRLGIRINGEEINGSPFKVYMAPSDGAVGVIVAIVIIVAVIMGLLGFVFFKRYQIAQKKKAWELKKALAYKEYQTNSNQAPVPLSAAHLTANEPEWEEDEFTAENNQADDHDDNEWAAMSQWVKQSKAQAGEKS